ncbi:uncharacterized protein RAG0_15323 [Rhynchosporium agropyri]|uniref:Transcription factor domain-containing protein n=1 Tax=Rhynchosporium agropyri TaxID=914238 RepID=A0A1E1LKL0_9HELO|nr:uncharacterized protein RAG0_15323 [Rhynchosporium agropyri]
MDLLTAGEVPFQLSVAFFFDTVDCPAITPFDSVNWRHMKLHVIELGMSNAAISSAIIAISALYKAQMYSLPESKALSLYQSSLESYEKLLRHPINNLDMIIVTVFLHCIFQYVYYETVPLLRDPSERLLASLRIWVRNASSHSELHSRIVIWLKLLYAATIRGGGLGLISKSIYDILPDHKTQPHISSSLRTKFPIPRPNFCKSSAPRFSTSTLTFK